MALPKKHIVFIINPISGGKVKVKIPQLIGKYIDRDQYNAHFVFTTHVGHGAQLAEEAAKHNVDVIVAVGGDGTINEVATKVMQHGKILGIIPFGSGNGLARFLKIPRTPKKAIKLLNMGKPLAIDVAKLNSRYFFNVAGMGFDAHLSHAFANNKTRGLKGYVEMGLKEIAAYQPQTYRLEIDGVQYRREAFAISVANSSQYGNNVYISPGSSVTDGLLEVCIIKPFPLYKLPVLAYQMVTGGTHQSAMVEIITGKNIKIVRQSNSPVHVDGEPVHMERDIDIQVFPAALNIIAKK